MTLALNDNDRRKLKITATADIDLTAATITLTIDGQPYPCTWTDSAVASAGTWTRHAITDDWFAGPAVPSDKLQGATVLAAGTHQPKVIVERSGTIIAAVPSRFRIDVT